MAEVLKQALGSLCNRTGWCYAVFWKLKRRSRMVLTWEDGYYEFGTSSALLTGNGRNLLEHGVCKPDKRVVEDQIQLAVAKMSFYVYSLGEGIIGRVAFTGKHQWIFANGERLECGPTSSEKFPDGWSNQFAAGIKTIAVVAVQQGVVQLGSTQMMTEDLNLVGQIRALFGTLQSVPGAFVSEFVPDARCLPLPKTPTRTTSCLGAVGRASLNSLNNRNMNLKAMEADHSTMKFTEPGIYPTQQLPVNSWSAPDLMTFTPLDQRTVPDIQSSVFQGDVGTGIYGTLVRGNSNSFSRDTNLMQPNNFKRLKFPYDGTPVQMPNTVAHGKPAFTRGEQPSPNTSADTCRSSASGFSGPYAYKLPTDSRQFDTNLWSSSNQSSVFSVGDSELFGEDAGMHPEEGFDYNSLFKAFQKDDLDDFNSLLASISKDCPGAVAVNGSQFAIGDELSEVLLPHQRTGAAKEEPVVTMSTLNDVKVQPKNVTPFELPSDIITLDSIPAFGDIFVGLSDSKPEQLLDAVVAGASTVPVSSTSLKESSENSVSNEGSRPVAAIANAVQMSKKQPVPASSFDRDVWADPSQGKKSEERIQKETPVSRKEEPARVIGRKRLRPGESPRPRPKDRQQIQDRVRELRDIVPNATKCSIDALLEKTIRHMKFLQSVTEHGDKWKAGADMKGLEHSSLESGASWALEYDGKGTGVPILVENLKQPRQMRVEMLCDERGMFWEIAENIRNLGLTILKGVMETRDDKVWARFNVEAAKEVNRVKVLWNLTQLLKLNPSKPSAPANSFTGSELTDVCSEPLSTNRFQSQVPSHAPGITVSPGTGW